MIQDIPASACSCPLPPVPSARRLCSNLGHWADPDYDKNHTGSLIAAPKNCISSGEWKEQLGSRAVLSGFRVKCSTPSDCPCVILPAAIHLTLLIRYTQGMALLWEMHPMGWMLCLDRDPEEPVFLNFFPFLKIHAHEKMYGNKLPQSIVQFQRNQSLRISIGTA